MPRPATICAAFIAVTVILPRGALSEAPGGIAALSDSLPLPETRILPGASDSGSVPARQSKSAGRAALYSAVIPGAGQVYNESYWKVPVILGFGVYFTSQWLHYNRLTTEARDRYDESLQGGGTGDETQLALREFYKDQRDTYTWYFFILYLLNVADAYVDASLYDFDIGDDLTLRLMPGQEGRVGVRVEF